MHTFLRLILLLAILDTHPVWSGTLRKGLRRRKLIPQGTEVSNRPPISIPIENHQPFPSEVKPEAEFSGRIAVDLPNEATQGQTKKIKKVRRKKVAAGLDGSPSLTFKARLKKRPLVGVDSLNPALNRTFDDQRFLSLFTIVSFKNDVCSSGTGTNGTCYSASDCSRLGGTGSGSCASGFGVCCLFTSTCGQTTSNNCTYFQNSGYPSTFNSVGSCQLTVNKANDNVCQLRLDFNNFVIAGPDTLEQVCTRDQLIITGGSPIPAICGVNSGQHVYVDTGLTSNNPITLTLVTGGTSFSRSFSVRVCQIECTSLSRASDGCMQYFTGVTGQVQTFNYNSGGGLQLSNTDYTICFRMERNFCAIQYAACTDTVNTPTMAFSITGSATTMVGALVGPNCATDWITIPCATNLMNPTAQSGSPAVCVDRICGMVFNSVTALSTTAPTSVFSFQTPFNLRVHTDERESNGGDSKKSDFANRGFCLDFNQIPCSLSRG